MLQMDLQKAYDIVEWSYVEGILRERGFPSKFIRWSMICLTTVSYRYMANGEPTSYLRARKCSSNVGDCATTVRSFSLPATTKNECQIQVSWDTTAFKTIVAPLFFFLGTELSKPTYSSSISSAYNRYFSNMFEKHLQELMSRSLHTSALALLIYVRPNTTMTPLQK